MVVDADSQATAADWARRGDLPARVEALPLDAETRVGPLVERVLTLQADHVVIDCPPHIGPATLAAIGIADTVLVPVTPSCADLVATDSALALVHDAQAARKDMVPYVCWCPARSIGAPPSAESLRRRWRGLTNPWVLKLANGPPWWTLSPSGPGSANMPRAAKRDATSSIWQLRSSGAGC